MQRSITRSPSPVANASRPATPPPAPAPEDAAGPAARDGLTRPEGMPPARAPRLHLSTFPPEVLERIADAMPPGDRIRFAQADPRRIYPAIQHKLRCTALAAQARKVATLEEFKALLDARAFRTLPESDLHVPVAILSARIFELPWPDRRAAADALSGLMQRYPTISAQHEAAARLIMEIQESEWHQFGMAQLHALLGKIQALPLVVRGEPLVRVGTHVLQLPYGHWDAGVHAFGKAATRYTGPTRSLLDELRQAAASGTKAFCKRSLASNLAGVAAVRRGENVLAVTDRVGAYTQENSLLLQQTAYLAWGQAAARRGEDAQVIADRLGITDPRLIWDLAEGGESL